MRTRRRLVTSTAAACAAVLLGTSAVAVGQEDDRDLERLEPILDRLGLAWGEVVDDSDASRLADKFEMDPGTRIDRSDVDRLERVGTERISIADDLRPLFEEFGRDYGTVVDPSDSFLFAQWLRVEVGRAVDPGDVPAIRQAAAIERRHPRFAMAVDVLLRLPSDRVELVGYHQSNHDGARRMTPLGELGVTMDSRGRDTDRHGSADIALPKGTEIYSPVSGTVVRSGTYTLYCDYRDDYVVIDPDDHPGWEVKMLHIDGVQVHQGDRVEAGVTLIAPRPTVLPFESQVNDHTRESDTPHVHVEVVDPSIPDRPSPGGGC